MTEKIMLDLVEKMGGLTNAVDNNTKIIIEFKREHHAEHHRMWEKMDKNTKFRHKALGIFTFISITIGAWWTIIKHKWFGGV